MLPWGPLVTLLRHSARAFADFAAAPSEMEARLSERCVTGRAVGRRLRRRIRGRAACRSSPRICSMPGWTTSRYCSSTNSPLTSKRVDVILAGRHPRTGAPSYVVVELKQWSEAGLYDLTGELVTVQGAPGGPRLHPVAQVQRYCDYLVDFTATLHDELTRSPAPPTCTTPQRTGAAPRRVPTVKRGRLFTGSSRGQIHPNSFGLGWTPAPLAPRTPTGSCGRRRSRRGSCLRSWRRSSPPGSSSSCSTSRQSPSDLVMHAVEEARASDQKTAVIITGGPGSGKSVIALSLMGALAAQGRTVVHATGSRVLHANPSRCQRIPKSQGGNCIQVLQFVHGSGAQRA